MAEPNGQHLATHAVGLNSDQAPSRREPRLPFARLSLVRWLAVSAREKRHRPSCIVVLLPPSPPRDSSVSSGTSWKSGAIACAASQAWQLAFHHLRLWPQPHSRCPRASLRQDCRALTCYPLYAATEHSAPSGLPLPPPTTVIAGPTHAARSALGVKQHPHQQHELGHALDDHASGR